MMTLGEFVADPTAETVVEHLRHWLGRIDSRDPALRQLLAERGCVVVDTAERERIERLSALLAHLVDATDQAYLDELARAIAGVMSGSFFEPFRVAQARRVVGVLKRIAAGEYLPALAGPVQIWYCGVAEHHHADKHEAEMCILRRDGPGR